MNDLTPKMNTSNIFQNNIERFDKAKEEVVDILPRLIAPQLEAGDSFR